LKSCLDKINSLPPAKQALQTLTRQGVKEVDVLRGLFLYCGGTEKEVREALKYGSNFVERLEEAIARLRVDVELVSRLRKESARLGIKLYSPAFDRYPKVVADVTKMLSASLLASRRGFTNVRVGKPGKGKPKLSAGRADHLVELAYLICEKVAPRNTHPRWRHYTILAPLVAAVCGDVEPNYVKIRDNLRNLVAQAQSRQVRQKASSIAQTKQPRSRN
jgi:hypothetical protein